MDILFEHLKEEVSDALKQFPEMTDRDFETLIENLVFNRCRHLVVKEKLEWIQAIYHSHRGLDVLQRLLDDDDVSEIMVNGHEKLFIERAGKMESVPYRFESREKLEDIIQMIVSRVNRSVNENVPIVDARWLNRLRVNVVLPPVSLDGPVMTLRKFPKNSWTYERYLEDGVLTPDAVEFLQQIVRSRMNIIIGGGTGSGKTTLLNVICGTANATERIITIEDTAELSINGIDNLVRLEARKANSEGAGNISLRDLIQTSLRMRPTRLIIGEVRGSEAFDMLQAMNTGHDGSMSTIHANSARDMFHRLETMVLSGYDLPLQAIRSLICSALEIFLFVGFYKGQRKLMEIRELTGLTSGEPEWNVIFKLNPESGMLMFTGNHLLNHGKLERYG